MGSKLLLCAALALPVLGAACASVPKASVAADAQAKLFATRPDRCGLYVYRNELLGAAIRMTVDLDGRALGATGMNTYLFTWVDPGPHVLASQAQDEARLEFEAVPGGLVFVWQEVKMGLLSANSALHLVDEARGRRAVQDCELVETKF